MSSGRPGLVDRLDLYLLGCRTPQAELKISCAEVKRVAEGGGAHEAHPGSRREAHSEELSIEISIAVQQRDFAGLSRAKL